MTSQGIVAAAVDRFGDDLTDDDLTVLAAAETRASRFYAPGELDAMEREDRAFWASTRRVGYPDQANAGRQFPHDRDYAYGETSERYR